MVKSSQITIKIFTVTNPQGLQQQPVYFAMVLLRQGFWNIPENIHLASLQLWCSCCIRQVAGCHVDGFVPTRPPKITSWFSSLWPTLSFLMVRHLILMKLCRRTGVSAMVQTVSGYCSIVPKKHLQQLARMTKAFTTMHLPLEMM